MTTATKTAPVYSVVTGIAHPGGIAIETMIVPRTETQVGTATVIVHHAGEMIAIVIGTGTKEEEIVTEAIVTAPATVIATETETGGTDPVHRAGEMTETAIETVPHAVTVPPAAIDPPAASAATDPRKTKQKKTNRQRPQQPHQAAEAAKK